MMMTKVPLQNLFRAIENLGVEMSYGIIFIGRQGLNIEDFARYVEKHYLCDEYLVQVTLRIMSHNSIKDIFWAPA